MKTHLTSGILSRIPPDQFSISKLRAARSIGAAILLMLCALTSVRAQSTGPSGSADSTTPTQTITGTVTDAQTKEPMPGVTVSIPALHIGAITRANGTFTIRNVPPGTHRVEAKLVGYSTKAQSVSVAPGQNATAVFAIASAPLQGNEVVVTGLTGEVDRRQLGNSIAEVPGIAINNVPSTNAIDALSGRVAGATVTRASGTPGAGSYMILRGRKSITGSSEPLYVVDGIIIDNSSLLDDHQNSGSVQLSNRVSDINPQDIQSVEILRGPSAAAMYGALAANGVVLITTKRGRVSDDLSKASITYTSAYQFDKKAGSFPLQTIYGQTTPYTPGHPSSDPTSYGPRLDTVGNPPVYAHDQDPFINANSYINSVTITGGIPTFSYLLSGTLENLGGVVLNSNLDRRNLRLNLFSQILPHVDIQNNTNYVSTNNSLPQEGSNRSGILLGSLRTPPEFNNQDYLEPNNTQRRFAGYDNPIWTQHNNQFISKIDRFLNSTDAKWTGIDWLVVDGRFGFDRYSYDNFERLAVGSGESDSRQGKVRHELVYTSNMNADLTATAQWKPTDDILTTLMLGGQTIWSNSKLDDVASTQTLPFFDQLSAGSQQTGQSTFGETKTVGQFAQLTGSFYDRYSITAALRRDNSSTFGASNKYHYYPKLGVAYNLSEESFWAPLKDVVNTFKLRASYGEGGSATLPSAYETNFLYSTYGFNDPWQRSPINAGRGGFIGIRQGGGTDQEFILAGNSNIRPELNIEREVGADLGLFHDRISIGFSFYHQSIYDMIVDLPVAGSTGFDQQPRNVGSMWNEGVEWQVGVVPLQLDDLGWTSTFTYARNYNLVTRLDVKEGGAIDLPGGFQGINNSAMVGHPLGIFRGVGWKRDANGHIMYSSYDAASKTVVNDDYGLNLVGAPITNPDFVILGDPNPSFTLSWRNDFTILKDLTIGVLLDGVFGQDIWNGTKGTLYNFGTAADTKDRDQPWFNFDGTPVMDYSNPDKPVQATRAAYYQNYGNGFYINEPFIEKGSYLKLREISLSYNWHGLQDWHINTLTFQFIARNLKTWTNYTGYDPEINTFAQSEARGYDYFTMPQVTSFRFGITLNY